MCFVLVCVRFVWVCFCVCACWFLYKCMGVYRLCVSMCLFLVCIFLCRCLWECVVCLGLCVLRVCVLFLSVGL